MSRLLQLKRRIFSQPQIAQLKNQAPRGRTIRAASCANYGTGNLWLRKSKRHSDGEYWLRYRDAAGRQRTENSKFCVCSAGNVMILGFSGRGFRMFGRAKEYFKWGTGRPMGTVWMMEKAYFEMRRRYPGKTEYAYLRLALQSRYPDRPDEVPLLAEKCRSLDDAITEAVALDFDRAIAIATQMNFLMRMSACTRCGKYRSLSTTDSFCYGCRKYFGFAACLQCHVYWDNQPDCCPKCRGGVWRITDGDGERNLVFS